MRKFRYVLLFFSMCFTYHFSLAQGFSQDYWHSGQIITTQNDTLKGQIRYQFDQEVVQLLIEDHVSTFTPVNTIKVVFTDTLNGQTRYILVKSRELKNGIVVKNFFEYDNIFKDYLLLSRERLVYTAYSSVGGLGFGGDQRQLDHLYFLYKEGEFIQLDISKRSLLQLFGTDGDVVWSFVKSNKLKLSKHKDVNAIFSYYNQLHHEKKAPHISN